MFGELYSAFDLYNKFSFFIEECPCFRKRFLQKPAPANSVIVGILKGEGPSAKHRQLLNMYQALTGSIGSTLEDLGDTTPECPVQTGMPSVWNSMCGQNYYYPKIADGLNLRIGLGEYSTGVYLPYEKWLTGQYNVSLSTVRKALSELEQREFVKALNGKGTIAIEPDDTKIHRLTLNSGYIEKVLRYLHALRFMALPIRPAALEAALRFTGDELDELADRLASPGSAYLTDMLEVILKHTTLEPLYVILSETNHLLEWGHHLAYYLSKRHTFLHLNKQVIVTFRQLNQGNADFFADDITDCCCYILVCMKKRMTGKYKFPNASNIRIPEKY